MTARGGGPDTKVALEAEAQNLVESLLVEPWGQTSPSVYETGRLVALAPWLSGQTERLRFLLRTQRADGGWGAPDIGYALVPTLSATDAIVGTLRNSGPHGHPGVTGEELVKAAEQALLALTGWLRSPPAPPDMPAIEHITAALLESIRSHLDALAGDPAAPLGAWPDSPRLAPPPWANGAGLEVIRARLRSGERLPRKLFHALEIAGAAALRAPGVRLETTGTVGASPAATAAWFGGPGPAEGNHPARRYLEAATRAHGGPVPCALPITAFERAWVLGAFLRAGVPVAVPEGLVAELAATLGPAGAPAAAGLPADADTTSGILYALNLLGAPHPPDALWSYETGTHFCTWQGEDGASVTTNAHVLEAFGHYLSGMRHVPSADRYAATVRKITAWLCERQRTDGSWQDRWHASPYYATACAVLALDRYGGEGGAAAVRRALGWVLATQRPDGSWGRWEGTAEESAYAVQMLSMAAVAGTDAGRVRAAARGAAFLMGARDTPTKSDISDVKDHPRLWHDKDLYLPVAIVRAALLAALHRHVSRV